MKKSSIYPVRNRYLIELLFFGFSRCFVRKLRQIKKFSNGIYFLLIIILFFALNIFSLSTVQATTSCIFTRNLSVGVKGNDVLCLQKYLNASGFTITKNGIGSLNNETTMYGSLTKIAVAKWQTANNISPAAGYFGALSREKFNKSATIEVSGWIPYWRVATGTIDAITHIDSFKEISPFGYRVQDNGTLVDAMDIKKEQWQNLIKTAREKKVKIIPTAIWNNGDAIDTILKDEKSRNNHIKEIIKIVSDNNFDGIDINYENKKAETKKYFSIFLKDLYKAIGKKFVVCTIEARTPLESRFTKIPGDIEYANDFAEINKYCDRVHIMTYDQGSIDLKLNAEQKEPYMPIADPKWVEKVINLASETIAKKKISIGVATYGYEFEVATTSWRYKYDLLWTFNPKYGLDLAQQLNITPKRNSAGELSFTYTTTTTSITLQTETSSTEQSNNPPLTTTTSIAETSASSTSASSETETSSEIEKPFRLVWWSDAKAIQDKINLAKKLGVRGIAIFKIDGGEDPAIWDMLK